MAVAGAAAGVTAVSGAMVIGSKRIIKMGADLDHMSTQTGVAISALMKIGQAYKDNGRQASAAGKDIGRMQKAIADAARNPGSSNDPFAQIGISAKELMELSPEQQFFRIAEAINGIQNQTEKAAAAMGIFGRSGAGLLTVFAGSNMRDINASLGRMPEIMEQFGGAMERVDTLMGRLPNKSDQFFTGFTAGVIGQLLPGLEKANEFDFTDLGENLGKEIGFGLELIQSGNIWDIFSLHATAAVIDFGEKLEKVTKAAFNAITNPDAKEMQVLGGVFMAGIAEAANLVGFSGMKADMQARLLQYHMAQEIAPSATLSTIFQQEMAKGGSSGIAAEMRAEADRLSAQSRTRANTNRRNAAEIGMFENTNIPGVGDIGALMGEVKRISDAVTDPESPISGKGEASDPWRETSSAVNTMQARGLGMGAMFVPKEVKDQVAILREMLAVIKRNAQSDKPLVI